MDELLVIGAGPAGLLAACIACQRGARVKVMATGIGTTHISPGWIGVLNDESRTQMDADERASGLGARLAEWVAVHPGHPYALAGVDALAGGLAALREVGRPAGINYVGSDEYPVDDARSDDFSRQEQTRATELQWGCCATIPAGPALAGASNFRLPTALGAVAQAAFVPESFAAGDLRRPGALLIAGPAGWRDFYPRLCADNLVRQGYAAQAAAFDLPEIHAGKFDAAPTGLARLFDRADVRERVAGQLKPALNGAARAGFPAVLGLTQHGAAWRELQDRLGVPVFEIPTLPPSVPGIRLYDAFKAGLTQAGGQILLDMTAVRGVVEGSRATGVVVPDIVRDRIYRPEAIILATGGLYGGGIISDSTGALSEAIFGLPLHLPGEMAEWFNARFLPPAADSSRAAGLPQGHRIHGAGVRVNSRMQPVDKAGRVLLENARVAGRLLAGYDPLAEGSTEGVWIATAYRAACL